MIIDVVLLSFLGFSIYSDLKFRKIFNFSVIAAIILGIGLNLSNSGFTGIGNSLTGLVAGFCFLIGFYLLNGVGAGDVKFMAAVGAIKGAKFVLIGGIYGAVIGGLGAICILLVRKKFLVTLKRIYVSLLVFLAIKTKESLQFNEKDPLLLPYAVFLSLGMLTRCFELNCR